MQFRDIFLPPAFNRDYPSAWYRLPEEESGRKGGRKAWWCRSRLKCAPPLGCCLRTMLSRFQPLQPAWRLCNFPSVSSDRPASAAWGKPERIPAFQINSKPIAIPSKEWYWNVLYYRSWYDPWTDTDRISRELLKPNGELTCPRMSNGGMYLPTRNDTP